MEKKKINWHNHEYYLLGQDNEGINYWLESAEWACKWYWGFGYVETFTNNDNPEQSKDIESHQHFDSLFLNTDVMCFEAFNVLLVDHPFTDDEVWKLLDLFKTFYTCKEYAATIRNGNSHLTDRKLLATIQNKDEERRINEIVIPEIISNVYKIMQI